MDERRKEREELAEIEAETVDEAREQDEARQRWLERLAEDWTEP